jgi:hypothetical protein
MRYVDLDAKIAGRPGGIDPGKYLEMLPVLAPRLPAGAWAFAADPGHYDLTSRHCVKDLTISDVQFSGDIRYQGVRELTMAFRYESGNWTPGGRWFSTRSSRTTTAAATRSPAGPGSLTVVCRDLAATWIPALCPDKPCGVRGKEQPADDRTLL